MNDLIAHSERPLILGTGLLALDVDCRCGPWAAGNSGCGRDLRQCAYGS